MIPISLDSLISAITGIVNPTALIKNKVQRNETVIKLLKQFNLDPEHPPADFSGYIDWLEAEVKRREIDKKYVPLACTKEEFDPLSQRQISLLVAPSIFLKRKKDGLYLMQNYKRLLPI